jgi:hypothetical protein
MKKYFLNFATLKVVPLFFITSFLLIQYAYSEEKIVYDNINPPKTKEAIEAIHDVIKITSDISSEQWADFQKNISQENFKILSDILIRYENELKSLAQKKRSVFFKEELQNAYRNRWSLLARYTEHKEYRDKLNKLWKEGIPKKGEICIKLLTIDWKGFLNQEDIETMKNEVWQIIETKSDIQLFDSFCQTLEHFNFITKKQLATQTISSVLKN